MVAITGDRELGTLRTSNQLFIGTARGDNEPKLKSARPQVDGPPNSKKAQKNKIMPINRILKNWGDPMFWESRDPTDVRRVPTLRCTCARVSDS